MLLESERELESTGKAWYLMRQMVPWEISEAAKGMTLAKGRHAAIFDCPQDHVEKVLAAEAWKGIKFSVAKELPELEPHPGQGNSISDDLEAQRAAKQKRWDKIKNRRSAEADEKQERRQWNDAKGNGRGTKRTFDTAFSGRGGGGGGRGASSKGR